MAITLLWVLSVVMTRLRTFDAGLSVPSGRRVTGYLVAQPEVGRTMVLYGTGHAQRIITSTVRRVLWAGDADTLYVETENSVYRVAVTDYAPFAIAATA